MQASYASGCALGSPHRMLGTRKSTRTIQYGFACLMRTSSEATEARSAVVADQTEGRMARQAHAASLLYVHPHPTAARRAAALASSEREMHIGARTSSDRFRGVLRHEKARWGNEYPNGLKTSQNAKYSVLFLRLVFSHESEMTERIQNRLTLLRWALRLLLVA